MLSRLRTGAKLWATFLVVIVLFLVVMAVVFTRLVQLRESAEAIGQRHAEHVRLATFWRGQTEVNLVRAVAGLKSADPSVDAMFKDDSAATSARIAEIQKLLDAADLSPESREQLKRTGEARTKVLDSRKAARERKAAGDVPGAMELIEKSYIPATTAYMKEIDRFVELQRESIKDAIAEMEASGQRITIALSITVVVVIGLVLVAAGFLTRSITQPLAAAVKHAEAVAQGDLSMRLDAHRHDEFGDLMRAFDAMTQSLSRIVSNVRDGTHQINTASTEIANGNQDLSNRTEQQASSLEQTAASMEELTATVKHSADSARQATQLAEGASQVARKGGDVVDRVVHTMAAIDQQSKKIADIIGVIDGIAFQTNILALNAAVEAARAGDQGRGFAVVAGEVRALAQRSASAAREIKTLITTSVAQVEEGTSLVRDAGSTMSEIVSAVQRVTDLISEISSATQEQSSGIGQVNQAVGHLDQMTQQNAALVEESTAAAHSLSEQAQRLADAVKQFRLA